MGIKQLTKLLTEYAPKASKEQNLGDYNGRKLAIDASMAIYQFLVAVRSSDGHGASQQLTNEAGEVTSHLQGLWYRTIKFVEAGIKPVYVFDGKPPTLKGGELAKRKAMKEKAQADLEAAKEGGNAEDIERFSRRTVHMTKDMQEDCKKLLRLMGMPVVEAPCEAEAQCAALAKADKVYAAASEDMDTLCFGTPRLVRRLWASEASKTPILEIDLSKVLTGEHKSRAPCHPRFAVLPSAPAAPPLPSLTPVHALPPPSRPTHKCTHTHRHEHHYGPVC
jgi:flap endonuclease-1